MGLTVKNYFVFLLGPTFVVAVLSTDASILVADVMSVAILVGGNILFGLLIGSLVLK